MCAQSFEFTYRTQKPVDFQSEKKTEARKTLRSRFKGISICLAPRRTLAGEFHWMPAVKIIIGSITPSANLSFASASPNSPTGMKPALEMWSVRATIHALVRHYSFTMLAEIGTGGRTRAVNADSVLGK
jgi:hypothetical protein